MDLTFIRQGYEDKGLNKEDLNADPFLQFESGFEEAKEEEPIPTAMSLSTVSNNGEPALRTVLLKLFDKNGFVFYTNLNSDKSKAIRNTSKISMCFHWKSLQRQIRIVGVASKVSKKEADDYYNSRAYGSRIAGWRIKPKEIEFWLDGQNRIHERLKYIRLPKKWKKVLLSP